MKEEGLIEWINRPLNNFILRAFSIPKTPTQVRKDLGIKKFNLKPFLIRNLLKCLNPESYKGRLYILTQKGRQLLKIQQIRSFQNKNYDLIGWIFSSPKQRLVVLKTMVKDSIKRTSEEIRKRAYNLNPCLSRISTKNILKELIEKGLVETEMGDDRKRYYWAAVNGKSLARYLQ
jgi:predicted transcriptional regulator